MGIEAKMTINFLENNPKGLKDYIIRRYGKYLKKILKKLEKHYGEQVDVYFTFLDYQWALDLDFYLVYNKSNQPLSQAGKMKLPVVFVIMPPGYQTADSTKRVLNDEGIYQVTKNNEINWLYKSRKITDISWKRILKKAVEVKLETG